MGVYGSVIITLSLITLYMILVGADPYGADLHGDISERKHADEGVHRPYQWPESPDENDHCYEEDSDCTGGLGPTETADEARQKMCDVWKTRKKYTVFQAKSYRAHFVGGSLYYIKVHVGGEDYIHICLFKDLPGYGGTLRFDGVQEGKTLDDHIVDFDRIEYSYE